MNRRKFITTSALGSAAVMLDKKIFAESIQTQMKNNPIVISTWDAGIAANAGAWAILNKGGRALDAVEAGVMVTENEINCCVGLGGNPDREGIVTLDACIMDDKFNCGSVAASFQVFQSNFY